MTDLLSRPNSRPGSSGFPKPGTEAPTARPLTVSAAIAGAGAAGTSLLTCMAIAVVGWFLADAGAHGETTDALRAGADAWLVGHGSTITVAGLPIGIIPLSLTAAFLVVSFRFGRWAGRTSEPIEDDRSLAIGVTIATGLYVVLTVLVSVLATRDGATVNLGRATFGALLVSGLCGGLGMAIGTGRFEGWVERVPVWVRTCLRGGLAGVLLVLAVSAVLLAVSLVLHLNEAANVMAELGLSTGDAVMYSVVMLAVAPNALLFSSAYLLGPGFAVGTGTMVSPTAVSLGAVPAFPLLAALPGDGATPWWTMLFLAVPAVAAFVGAALTQRLDPVTEWDMGALRGAGAGFSGGLLITLLIGLSGGSMGTGRLADIGAPFAEVLVTACGSMAIGGLLGGLAMTWWQRRAAAGLT